MKSLGERVWREKRGIQGLVLLRDREEWETRKETAKEKPVGQKGNQGRVLPWKPSEKAVSQKRTNLCRVRRVLKKGHGLQQCWLIGDLDQSSLGRWWGQKSNWIGLRRNGRRAIKGRDLDYPWTSSAVKRNREMGQCDSGVESREGLVPFKLGKIVVRVCADGNDPVERGSLMIQSEREPWLMHVSEEVRRDGLQSTWEEVGVRWETREHRRIWGHRHRWIFTCGTIASGSLCCFSFLSETRLKVLSRELRWRKICQRFEEEEKEVWTVI